MYIYFKKSGGSDYVSPLHADIICRNPKLVNIHNVIWTVVSVLSFRFMQFVEYVAVIDGIEVAYAQVVHKLPIFGFMDDKKGIHIGPCFTNPEFRGKGLYPLLLSRIMKDFHDRTVYIFTSEDNKASLKGIEKVGFKRFAKGYKNRFGKYVIVEKL